MTDTPHLLAQIARTILGVVAIVLVGATVALILFVPRRQGTRLEFANAYQGIFRLYASDGAPACPRLRDGTYVVQFDDGGSARLNPQEFKRVLDWGKTESVYRDGTRLNQLDPLTYRGPRPGVAIVGFKAIGKEVSPEVSAVTESDGWLEGWVFK